MITVFRENFYLSGGNPFSVDFFSKNEEKKSNENGFPPER